MLNQLVSLVNFKREADRLEKEIDFFLKSYIQRENPDLAQHYSKWFAVSRNAHTVVFIKIMSKALCDLEGIAFDYRRQDASIYSGAIGRISDDLIDDRLASPRDAAILEMYERESQSERFSLLFAFEKALIAILPPNFRVDFKNVIRNFNDSQADSLRQFQDIGPDQITDIRNKNAGYVTLLLYSVLFPEKGDLSLNLTGGYNLAQLQQQKLKLFTIDWMFLQILCLFFQGK